MTQLRALLFNLFFFGATFLMVTLLLPLLWVRPSSGWSISENWTKAMLGGLKVLTGLGCRERDRKRLPDGPALIVAKHQSALETLALYMLLNRPAFVLKKELVDIPVFGKFLSSTEQIAVDRSAGAAALKQMVEQAGKAFAAGRKVIIFPEGTRTPPGSSRAYHPGVFALHKAFPDVPVVPVALNSGMFWRRNAFTKYKGSATFHYLEPMTAGLDRRTFMQEIKTRIDGASVALEQEAATEFALPQPDLDGDRVVK